MQVQDIMAKDIISVEPTTEVKDVANLLTEKKIHGVPVVDKDKKVIGIVTETNFFARVNGDLYLSKFVKAIKRNKLPDIGDLDGENEITAKTTVENIMTKNCVTVEPEMNIEELFEVFRKNGFYTIPVADKEGVLVGVVTLADIIAMSAKMNQSE
ncbi:MAG: CBS domain-containing protein [Candidatus Moranbacteria bacterium]|jgi:CBS-domain-containing membrane protein|nr:CBS domain-containing protein [Candidatus Moranbacteria bacterium]